MLSKKSLKQKTEPCRTPALTKYSCKLVPSIQNHSKPSVIKKWLTIDMITIEFPICNHLVCQEDQPTRQTMSSALNIPNVTAVPVLLKVLPNLSDKTVKRSAVE